MRPLNARALASFATFPTPTYDRTQVRSGIVHFGVGGFHRAHQAMYLDQLMNQGKALDWGISGVGLLPQDRRMHEVMIAQDCLYTLVVKHPDGSLQPRVVGSIVQYLFAPDDPEAVLELMADPGTRIVSLTITEGGYLVHPVTGDFDADDPAIQNDLRAQSTPSTAFGFITEALSRRRERGGSSFTATGQRLSDEPERRAWCGLRPKVVLNCRVVGVEVSSDRVHKVAPFGNGQGDDPGARIGHQLKDSLGVVRGEQVLDDRADNPRLQRSVGMLDDQGVQAVLSDHDLVHTTVLREQPDPADPPVEGLSLVHQLVEVHRLMSPVEAADPNVHDSASDLRTVVGRRREGGETRKRTGVEGSHGLFLGEGLDRFTVGEQVTVNPNVFCSYCDYCLSGRLILCSNDAGAKAERPALPDRAQVFMTCPACRTSRCAGILGPPPTGSRPTLRRHYH